MERIKPSQAHIEFKLQERVKELSGQWHETNMALKDCGLDSLGVVELGLFIEDAWDSAFNPGGLRYTDIQLTGDDSIQSAAEKVYKHLTKENDDDKTT